MVLRTFNFWGFCSLSWKTPDFNDMFSKKSLKSMVLSTFNFWGFCGQYRDFHYYFSSFVIVNIKTVTMCLKNSNEGPFGLKTLILSKISNTQGGKIAQIQI